MISCPCLINRIARIELQHNNLDQCRRSRNVFVWCKFWYKVFCESVLLFRFRLVTCDDVILIERLSFNVVYGIVVSHVTAENSQSRCRCPPFRGRKLLCHIVPVVVVVIVAVHETKLLEPSRQYFQESLVENHCRISVFCHEFVLYSSCYIFTLPGVIYSRDIFCTIM